MAFTGEKAFQNLGLNECLAKQCNSMGMKRPTEIQLNCIPPILEGRDCIGCAKTGSGKTAAFALPILQKLCEDPYGIFAVVLTPTRELAYQIAEQFRVLGKPVGVRECVTVGGLDMMKQGLELSQHPHIVIATPGRLADHLHSTDTVSLKKIKFLVLDEADRLLEDAFANDLQTIFDAAPENRQTLLFSATLTDTIEQLKTISASEPFCFQVQSDIATVEELDQRYVLMPELVKDCYLVYLLREHCDDKSAIVFTSTCMSCQVLSLMLKKIGLPCVALHSLMSQNSRLSSLAKFKSGIVKILVATDVANRGLDIPSVELVLNSNVPKSPKGYIHRVGRTARAGRGGMAVTLVTQYDVHLVKRIEDHINTKLVNLEVPEKDTLKLLKGVNVARREVELRVRDSSIDEKRMRNKRKRLILLGKDPEQAKKKMAKRSKDFPDKNGKSS